MENPTIVTTVGEVIREGGNHLVIMDAENKLVIMEMDEVSDDSTCNVFIKCFHKFHRCLQMDAEEHGLGAVKDPMTHELMIERKGEGMQFRLPPK